MKGNDYNITYLEACKLLKKSKRTVSRYIKKGLLNPEMVGNEYRFNQVDLLKLNKTDKTKRTDKTKKKKGWMASLNGYLNKKK